MSDAARVRAGGSSSRARSRCVAVGARAASSAKCARTSVAPRRRARPITAPDAVARPVRAPVARAERSDDAARARPGSFPRPPSSSSTTCTRTSTCSSTARTSSCPPASASTSRIPRVHTFNDRRDARRTAASPRRATSRASRRCTRTTSPASCTPSRRRRKDNTLGSALHRVERAARRELRRHLLRARDADRVYVNGTKFAGDPRTIPLSNLKEIAIVVGTPPAQIPNTADWNQI